jgi:hypothetical protein
MSPDMKWYCLLTVEQISAVRAVVEAAKAARVPIEAYMRARGVPNDTITELVVRVENLLVAEGE